MNKNYLNNVRLRERRLSAHQCLACGKQLEEDYTSIYCEACREKRNKNAREEQNGIKVTKYVQDVAELK